MSKKHKFNEDVEGAISKIVIDHEYYVAKENQSPVIADFEAYLDGFSSNVQDILYLMGLSAAAGSGKPAP